MPRQPQHHRHRQPNMKKSFLLAATLYLAGSTVPMGVNAVVNPQVLNNVNITAASLGVRDSISSPTCNATEPCITLANDVVPRCMQLGNDPGCWCGNHDPLHYCSLCMSTPTDNTTTPDQTELAISSHRDFHIFCAAYANRTSGSDDQNGGSGGGSSSNTGAIVGGVVGGVAVIALIALGVFWYHKKQKKQAVVKGSPFEQQQMMMAGGASGMDTTAGTRNSFFSAFSSSKKPSPDNLGGGDFSPSTTAGPDRGTGFTPHPYMLHPSSPATNAPLQSPLTASSTPPLNSATSGGFASQQQRPDLGYDTSMLRDLEGPHGSGGYGSRAPYNG